MLTESRWLLPQVDARQVGELSTALKIHPLAARVLLNRGYSDPDEAERFLHPTLKHLHDPYQLLGMRIAVDRLLRAVKSGEKILLYGDYDVDGTCSIVILKKAIELAGGTAIFHVPHRLRDGYGMRSDVIEHVATEGVSLVISVDTGIRANEAVQHARDVGIDVIITDHHLPEQDLPPALAEVVPNLPAVKEGKSTAIICSNFTCRPPISDPDELAKSLHDALMAKAA